MGEKIMVDEAFTKLLIVTSADMKHPCLDWLRRVCARLGISLRVQTGKTEQDMCTLLSASYVAVSVSSFPETLAVLSDRAQRIYKRSENSEHSILVCKAWRGTDILEYDVPIA